MVVAFLRGLLRTKCEDAISHLAEDAVLDALDAEIAASGREIMSLATAATIGVCDPSKRSGIMERVDRAVMRASQLRRVDLYDSMQQLGMRGFGIGQKVSLVKLFRLTKKHGIIQSIHESAALTVGEGMS